jgi:hypothetical protein
MEGGVTKGIWGFEKEAFVYPYFKNLDFVKPFEVHIDASDFAISKVFIQYGHPIAFKSKKLCGAHLQWPIHEKELYIMMCFLKTWGHYLGTYKTKVFTKMSSCSILKRSWRLQQSS